MRMKYLKRNRRNKKKYKKSKIRLTLSFSKQTWKMYEKYNVSSFRKEKEKQKEKMASQLNNIYMLIYRKKSYLLKMTGIRKIVKVAITSCSITNCAYNL